MECNEARQLLPAIASASDAPRDLKLELHLAGCDDCMTELTAQRELVQQLGALSEITLDPSPWLVDRLVREVGTRARRNEQIRRQALRLADPKVITGGVLVAAGVAGVILLNGRRRRKTRSRRLREVFA